MKSSSPLPSAPCALPTSVGGVPLASRTSLRPQPRRLSLPPQPGSPTWQSRPPCAPVTSADVPSVAGRRRSRAHLLRSRTVRPAALLCARKPTAPSTLLRRVALGSLTRSSLLLWLPTVSPVGHSQHEGTTVPKGVPCRLGHTYRGPTPDRLAHLRRGPDAPRPSRQQPSARRTFVSPPCCWRRTAVRRPSASRPPAAVTSIAHCRCLGSPHAHRIAPLASRPRRSAERVRLPLSATAARPRAPPSHVLVQRRRRALLLSLYCHHRRLGRRRHSPSASSLPSPIAVGSSPAVARRAARLVASLGALIAFRSATRRAPRRAAAAMRSSRLSSSIPPSLDSDSDYGFCHAAERRAEPSVCTGRFQDDLERHHFRGWVRNVTSLSDPDPKSLCSVSFTVPTRARSSQKGPSFSWGLLLSSVSLNSSGVPRSLRSPPLRPCCSSRLM